MRKKVKCPGCLAYHRSFPDRTVTCQVCRTRFQVSNDGKTITFSANYIPSVTSRFFDRDKKVSK